MMDTSLEMKYATHCILLRLCVIVSLPGCGFIGVDSLPPDSDEEISSASGETESDTVPDTDTDMDTATDECAAVYREALVCTGFEDSQLGTTYFRDGDGTVVDAPVQSGGLSARFETTNATGYAHARSAFAPLHSGTIYFRGYFYLPQGTVVDLVKLLALEGWGADFDDTDVDGAELDVDISVVAEGGLQLYFQQSEARYFSAPGVVPEDKWFCLLGSVDVSADNGAAAVGINGTDLISARGEITAPPSGISRASYGIGWTDVAQPTAQVYVDSIVFDTMPVTCQ